MFRIAFCGEDKLGMIANKQVVQPIFHKYEHGSLTGSFFKARFVASCEFSEHLGST